MSAASMKVDRRGGIARILGAALLGVLASASHAQPKAGSQLGGATPLTTPAATPTSPSWSSPPAWSMPAASAAPRGTSALAQKPALAGTAAAIGRKGDLFSLDDKAVVKGDGKETSVGAIKQRLLAEIAAKAGPMKTVKASARNLDTLSAGAAGAKSTPVRDLHSGGLQGLGKSDSIGATTPIAAGALARGGRDIAAKSNSGAVIADLYCTDKGPPTITEVEGKLRAGGKVKLWGKCFGQRTGRVEVIGQFPGGKLNVAFTSWDQTLIELDVPATVRGAPDGTVAVTVVTADGKATPAATATYVAARERVEVPDRLWSPASAFETAATSNNQPNPAEAGQLARTVRINPQCGLESMVADVIAGDVTSIDGFERGPPNEAAVTIGWRGTCVTTTTWTSHNYVIVQTGADVSISEACRVALRPRAWAQCPAGIAP